MFRSRWIVNAFVLAAILITTPWIAGRTSRPTDQSQNSLTIGAILPLTGDLSSYAAAAKRGIDVALDEVNARGGPGAHPLRVIYENDQGQAARAVPAMQKLVSVDRVPL